jgi:hypothetical protein
MQLFTLRKLSLEFDWLKLWNHRWKKADFRRWYEATRTNTVREFNSRSLSDPMEPRYRMLDFPASER